MKNNETDGINSDASMQDTNEQDFELSTESEQSNPLVQRIKKLKFNAATIAAMTIIVFIISGSAYALVNGTILQHRPGDELADCSGDCSGCEIEAQPTQATNSAGTSTGMASQSGSTAQEKIAPQFITLSGAIEEQPTNQGTALRLKTERDAYYLDAGPKWFIDYKKFTVKAGDKATADGFVYTLTDGSKMLVVSSLSNESTKQNIDVRDKQGVPYWKPATASDCSEGAGSCGSQSSCGDCESDVTANGNK